MSQREASDILGYSGKVTQVEAGYQHVTIEDLFKYAQIYGVRPAWLLTGVGPMRGVDVDTGPARLHPVDNVPSIRLAIARRHSRLTIKQVAHETGIKMKIMEAAESGTYCLTDEELIELARLYEVSVDWLVDGRGSMR